MKKTVKMNKIDLIDRQSGLEYDMSKVEDFCFQILEDQKISGWEFSLLFSDDEYIADLNKTYRGKDGPTDVLSFCESDNDSEWKIADDFEYYYAGDIVISVESLLKNSKEFDVPVEEELKRLLIHGILHLSGMDHETNCDDEKMLIKQEDILNRFGDYVF